MINNQLRRYVTSFLFSFLFLATSFAAYGQTPFTCDGSGYMVTRDATTSGLYRLNLDAETQIVNFGYLGNLGVEMNGIGYRITDNFIYGVNPINKKLYQIDAAANVVELKQLPLTSKTYTSGDITTDGKHLVLVGFNSANTLSIELAFVDLSDPTYPITKSIDISDKNLRIYDMAFHPLTNELYAFDYTSSSLVRIDINTGTTLETYDPTATALSVGTLYFDKNGDLFGYGGAPERDQKRLYQIDILTGAATQVGTGPVTDKTDGCSCASTLAVKKTASKETAPACAVVDFTFDIYNQTTAPISDLQLNDVFPVGFEITAIDNALGGTINSGVGSNVLDISGIYAEQGSNEIVVSVTFSGILGRHGAQAILSNLPTKMGTSRVSDDTRTLIEDDSTYINIYAASNVERFDTLTICQGEIAKLSADNPDNDLFIWNTGSSASTIDVSTPGDYWVKEVSSCDSLITNYNVMLSSINVSLDPNSIVADAGDRITVFTEITGLNNNAVDYQWDVTGASISCPDCASPEIQIQKNGQLKVTVENDYGCVDSETLPFQIDRSPKFHIPNAFSPNNDEKNDVFYVIGKGYQIQYFSIYDRWGEKLFEVKDGFTNDPAYGWDASSIIEKGMNSTVFIYKGIITDPDGFRYPVSGTITMVL